MVSIGETRIHLDESPFIIAEMSGNHNQSLNKALEIVEAAAFAGADAIKLQTLKPETITLNLKTKDFIISDPSSPWYGNTLYDLYKKAYTPWEWHNEIIDFAKQKGLQCISTPFCETAVDFLEELNIPAFKIASFENNHIPLIKKAAKCRKPLIISTGMAYKNEIKNIFNAVEEINNEIILLKCTSAYPSRPSDCNLRTIVDMRNTFNCEVGLSDHTMGIGVSIAAIATGATVIEKHLTTSRSEGGVDSSFSMEPDEFKLLVTEAKNAHKALGTVCYKRSESEQKNTIFRRSLYAVKDIETGEKLTSENIAIIRPGHGGNPSKYEELLGTIAKHKITKGDRIG